MFAAVTMEEGAEPGGDLGAGDSADAMMEGGCDRGDRAGGPGGMWPWHVGPSSAQGAQPTVTMDPMKALEAALDASAPPLPPAAPRDVQAMAM